jgi:hypothetical protein
MICERCEKKFVRVPPHKRRRGVVIQSRAKLCPECRKLAVLERVQNQKNKKYNSLTQYLKGGNNEMVDKKIVKKAKDAKKADKAKKAPSKWQEHLSKVYKEMKKKHPDTKLKDAMKEAKKTYKK